MTRQEQMDALVARLTDGFARIGKAMNEGVPVENWETRWIELLREYEAISDELAAAVPEQATLPLGRVEVAA